MTMLRPALVALVAGVLLACACAQDVDEGKSFMTQGQDGDDGTSAGDDGSQFDMPGDEDSSSSGSTTGDTGDTGDTSDGDSGSTDGGDEECGNGQIDMSEQCDGANLNGFDCTQLGYGGGTLGCDPMTCTYDTSNCTPDMGGTTG